MIFIVVRQKTLPRYVRQLNEARMQISKMYLTVSCFLVLSGCISPYVKHSELPNFTSETTTPGGSILRGGKSVALLPGNIGLQTSLPDIELTDDNWKNFKFEGDGQVKIISIVPSIDTRICEQQTHLLSETTAIDPRVKRFTVSRDLPGAQKRFALESGIENIKFLSDYKMGAFGRASGLLMADTNLLARAIIVVDNKGVVQHFQIVSEMTNLPDLAKAMEIANRLADAESY